VVEPVKYPDWIGTNSLYMERESWWRQLFGSFPATRHRGQEGAKYGVHGTAILENLCDIRIE
jgi:hypothetical protein